jgi:hypothetical protein
MSIPVQCPNPDCGKVHQAKDKYAGLQCYCPACRAVMEVPVRPAAPRIDEKPAPANGTAGAATLEEAEAAAAEALVALGEDPPAARKGAEAEAVSLNVAVEEDALAADPADDEEFHLRSSNRLGDEEGIAAAELDDALASAARKRPRPAVDEDEDRPAPSAGERFKWPAAVTLALAALGLLGVAAMPFLPGPQLTLTGALANQKGLFPNPGWGMKDELKPYVIAIPCVVAGLVLLGLVLAVLQRRFSVIAFLTTYPAAAVTAVLLLILSIGLAVRLKDVKDVEKVVAAQKARVPPAVAAQLGTASITVGTSVVVAFGCAAAAFVLLCLSLPLMHRAKWAKVVSAVLVGLGGAGEALAVFLIVWFGSQ